MPGDAAPVIKIGVIAPFEGTGRPLGYAVLPAIKAAAEEANASGDLGRYRVLVVAFNDDLDAPTAAAQAQALALDPDVLAVVGPWTAETAAAATPILAEAGLPALVATGVPIPSSGEKWGDAALAQAAALAGQDARVLLDALAADIRGTWSAHARRGGCRAEEPMMNDGWLFASTRLLLGQTNTQIAATTRQTMPQIVSRMPRSFFGPDFASCGRPMS